MKKVFSARLASLCAGKSIAECAREWGIKQASLDRYVKAQRTPTGDAIVEICMATGVSADWLLGLSDDPTPPTDRPPRPASATPPAPPGTLSERVAALEAAVAALRQS